MPIKTKTANKYFFKKSLGQNILVDGNIIKKIVSKMNLKAGEVVLEIGPGLGALTDEIVAHDVKVIAIEKDTRFAEMLKDKYTGSNVEIINGDALKAGYSKLLSNEPLRSMKAVGNLPYNVSTQIVFKLLEHREYFKSFLMMFQKEVAERIIAVPSTKDYGIFSVITQYYSRPDIVMTVPATCFKPRPKIESAIVKFEIYDAPPFPAKDEILFKGIVKAAFSHRRKTLNNCFKSFMYNNIEGFDFESIFCDAGIDLQIRGETLSVADFVRLSNSFSRYISNLEKK